MVRNEYVGGLISNSVGRLKEVDVEEGDFACGEYMRISISLDITKPLLRRKKFTIGYLPPVWIRFSYKRLPDYCYKCEIIGHNHRKCKTWNRGDEKISDDKLPYGKKL